MGQLKKLFLALSRRVGLYERLKTSCLYDVYWLAMDRRLIDSRNREVAFYRDLLRGFRRGDTIFDVGANDGTKANVFLKLGARVVAIEPDKTNQEVLRQRFLQYRWTKMPVIIVGKAVSDRSGSETMWVDAPGSWMNTLATKWVDSLRRDEHRFGKALSFAEQRTVETATLEEIIAEYGVPAFIKVDVEGYEIKVLRGLHQVVPYISFEVNLPEFRSEGLECVRLLAGIAEDGEFNYSADLERGLVMERWLRHQEFSSGFEEIHEECVEVFWRAPVLCALGSNPR